MNFAATVIGAGAIAAASLAAHAGTPIAWDNPLGGEWRTAANWDPMLVPGLSDDALLGLTGAYTVSVFGADAAVANLNISNPLAALGVTGARVLDIGQSAQNQGVITVNPTGSASTTQLRFADGVTLTGSGRIVLNGSTTRAWITPATAGAVFTQGSGHTIQGEGTISTGMTNNGLVLADVPGADLTLNSVAKANNAQMTAANGGTLLFQGSTISQSASATITADGAGSTVELSGVTVNGGTIQAINTGLISVFGGDATINTLTLIGDSQITSARVLDATGAIAHTGHMVVNPSTSASTTSLRVADGTAFTGNGVITLNGTTTRAWITPATAGAVFTQSADHTIDGYGRIDAGLTNNGLVLANSDGDDLVLTATPKTNNAQMTAADGGTLLIQSTTINQAPTATITADGPGSVVELTTATVNGGTIQAINNGLISVFGGDATINALTLTGDSQITSSRVLDASGTIAHSGHMVVNPATSASTTSLRVADGTAFTGDGVITLNGITTRAWITPATAGAVFTQSADHTIQGYGQINAGLTNNGLVLANSDGDDLVLTATPKTNNAQMTAADGGTLLIQSTTINQAPTATITADGAGSVVELTTATVNGGTIQAINNGLISVFGGDATINALTLIGDSQITSARVLDATGAIAHTGHMVVNPAGSASTTTLRVADGTSFSGNGLITLNGAGTRSWITPAAAGAVLTLGAGQTLEGTGQIATILNLEGTLAPGLSVGTMTASQPVSLSATSTFEAEVAGTNDADQLDSSSSFQAAGTLNVAFVDDFNPPLTWSAVIVDATQGVSGAFDTVNAPQPIDPRLEFRVVYLPNQIRVGAYCKADANADGILNFFDISQFIADYNAGSPAADIAAPFGALNFFDIAEFIARYNTGCP